MLTETLVVISYMSQRRENGITEVNVADIVLLIVEKSSGSHPYEVEITALLENPRPEFDFLTTDLDSQMSDSYVWVETKSQLKELANVLSKEKVFSVDTEQHSLRSFLGFTALIQVKN